MGLVDFIYWKLAAICFIVGVAFFFFTTESLVKGHFKLPSWVFSLFTLTVGVFFFTVFVRSMNEFMYGQHDSLDEFLDMWSMVQNFIGLN